MRNILNSVISVAAMVACAASHSGQFTLAEDTYLQGVWFSAGTVLKTFDQGNSPTPEEGILARQYVDGAIIWEKQLPIKFDSAMKVVSGTVAKGNYSGKPLKPGSRLIFGPTGIPTSISFDVDIPLSSHNTTITKGTQITTYPNGSIRSATTGVMTVVSLGSSKRYLLSEGITQFWPADALLSVGTVRRGTLLVPHAHVFEVFPANTVVGFDGAGELSYVECQTTCSYKRIVMTNGGTVDVTSAGEFTLIGKSPVTVETSTYPARQKLLLTYEGKVILASAP